MVINLLQQQSVEEETQGQILDFLQEVGAPSYELESVKRIFWKNSEKIKKDSNSSY